MDGRRRSLATLQRYVQQQTQTRLATRQRCELCSAPIASMHRHLLAVASRQITCICRACAILFDPAGASSGKYRLIPDRYLLLADFQITDTQWQNLQMPVGLAFCFYSTPAQQPVAYYPSPMGATASPLQPHTWEELRQRNVVLNTLQQDVEALLMQRARGDGEYFVVPVDQCYRLVGLMRQSWRGLSGGQALWEAVSDFFETLRKQTRTVWQDDFEAMPQKKAT